MSEGVDVMADMRHRIRTQGAYVIRSAESRPGPVRAIIVAAESRAEQRGRAFPRVVTTGDLALVRAVKAHRQRPISAVTETS